jgi:ATP-dependent Clp protease, protease subunit
MPRQSKPPKSAQKNSPQTKEAVPSAKPLPSIDTTWKNDRAVEVRSSVAINAVTVAQIQRALLLQRYAKNTRTSTLKFYIGPSESNKYRYQDQAALADALLLISHPVDVLCKAALSVDALKGFLSATGKRYMFAGATINMGVVTTTAPYAKNKDSQVRRQLFNDYINDLIELITLKTGETDRSKIYAHLVSAKTDSALEALYYGEHGLVEGILMGPDQVITRKDLNAFYRKQKMKPGDIAAFNRDYMNVYQVPTSPLKLFAPSSLPDDGTQSLYKSLKKPEPDKKPAEDASKNTPKNNAPLPTNRLATFYFGEKKLDELPYLMKASKDKSSRRIMIENPPITATGILDDDVIFFNDGFADETAEQIAEALVALDHKKQALPPAQRSHIKIIENSPGGSVHFGQELRSLIKSLLTPVDVIVMGMGASCGSWLLCSATGNRFATPHSRIMFHEAATSISNQVPANHYNEITDGLDQATLDYISVVSTAVGRPFNEVLKDFDRDVWLNPLEAMMYGDKGFIDGILVSADTIITRQDVEVYLKEVLGSMSKMKAYIKEKIEEKRDPRLGMVWQPDRTGQKTDPFETPLQSIQLIAQRSAKPLAALKQFSGSSPWVSELDRSIDFFNVVIEEEKKK